MNGPLNRKIFLVAVLSAFAIGISSYALSAASGSSYDAQDAIFSSGGENASSVNFNQSIAVIGLPSEGGVDILNSIQPEPSEADIAVKGTVEEDNASIEVRSEWMDAAVSPAVTGKAFEAPGIHIKEGENVITVKGEDTLGNIRKEDINVTLDTISPSVPTLLDYDKVVTSSPQILKGSKQSGASIWVDGKEVIPCGDETYWEYNLPLNEGENYFQILSKDRADNQSAEFRGSITLSIPSAAIEINYPSKGNVLTQASVVVKGTIIGKAVDSIVVNGVAATINGTSYEAAISFDASFEDTWIPIIATASDSTGDITYSTSVNVFLDLTPPYRPGIDDVQTPTNKPLQLISGRTNNAGAEFQIFLNKKQIIPAKPGSYTQSAAWQYEMELVAGSNPINIYVRTRSGAESGHNTSQDIFYDPNRPIINWVNDDDPNDEKNKGGVYIVGSDTLYARWNANDDVSQSTGITKYEYALGTSKIEKSENRLKEDAVTDVLDWQEANGTYVYINDRTLEHGKAYYIYLIAIDGAGNVSYVLSSDGITADKNAPIFKALTPVTGAKFAIGESVNIAPDAQDKDLDELRYKYLVDGLTKEESTLSDTYNWNTAGEAFGRHIIRVEADDSLGGVSSKDEAVFLYYQPVSPPSN